MNANKDLEAVLKFEVKAKKGELDIVVVDAENNVLFEKAFTKSEVGETKISLKKNHEYRVKFIGKDARGIYFCQWVEIIE